MSYTNPRHEGRLILIPNLQDAFAILHVSEAPRGSIESALEGAESNLLYKCDEVGSG
ncbi:TPA: site-specific integrase, partial [Pseudomonas aeruginosa]|nr:site-specific integrase [Pseudomonas aeruginosa]